MYQSLLSLKNKIFWRNLRELIPGDISKTLDLGSGLQPKNDFDAAECWSLDIIASPNPHHIVCDATQGSLPIEDNSFELVTAYDFLEHIPRVAVENSRTVFPFVNLMNEIDRILKPGGHFYSYTPVYPKKTAFQDPTHVNIMTKDTLKIYFSGQEPLARMYGFSGNFTVVKSGWKGSRHYCLMTKNLPT